MTMTDGYVTRVGIGHYDDYASAERAVDHLSDQKFPVESLTIIGRDLQMVEKVLGRLTWGRAGLAGLGTGAWFGLLIGLLFSIFAISASGAFALLFGGLFYGALFGLAFALISYGMTRGRRDFTSRSNVVPTRYELLVETSLADRARDELAALR